MIYRYRYKYKNKNKLNNIDIVYRISESVLGSGSRVSVLVLESVSGISGFVLVLI